MTLEKLCHKAGVEIPIEFSNIQIQNVVSDSRRVKQGDLFVALDGTRLDGHNFVKDAIDNGASAVVIDKYREVEGIPYDFPVIRTRNCREACARLFASLYDNPQDRLKIIGITGTNGKTTICAMLHHILESVGFKCGIIGTTGSYLPGGEKIDVRPYNELANMTTPDPEELYRILSIMVEAKTEYVVMEVTSHALALSKVEPIEFEASVFTNLTEEHLDFHADMESYFAAKFKLLRKSKFVITNCDDLYGRAVEGMLTIPVYTCTCEGRNCDYCARDIKISGSDNVEYKIVSNKFRVRISCPVPGKFSVMNSLQASACAHRLGVDAKTIKYSFQSFTGVPGRLERINTNKNLGFDVFIDYAHTPDALENLLRTVRTFRKEGQRIVLLFGCGGDRDHNKRSHMGYIASVMADFVIVTSDNSRSEKTEDIINQILSGMDSRCEFTVIPNRRDAIEYAIQNAKNSDIILLAGKGHETYEIDNKGKKTFIEKEIVLKAIEKYNK